MKKIDYARGVLVGIVLAFFSVSALACSPVAKVIYYTKADMKAVEIIRVANHDSGRPASDMLCPGDRVKVPQGSRVIVKYFTKNKFEVALNGPAQLPVTHINLPTKLANSGNMVADIGKWFTFSGLESSEGMVTRGGCLPGNSISSPLDNGHEIEKPFMLKSDLKKLYFFWCGGVAPYSVEILGRDGQRWATQVVSEPSAILHLEGIASNKAYVLSVRSSDGMVYQKDLLFKSFNSSTESGDGFKLVVDLLYMDTQDNWRAQLWSYLHEQQDSPIKSIVMEHLQAGDM